MAGPRSFPSSLLFLQIIKVGMMPTILDRLPPELRFMVFSLYFGLADEDFTLPAFYKLRAVLCASCRSLAALVRSEPMFWRCIVVTPRSPPEFIALSISRSDKLHFEFFFRFLGIQSTSLGCCDHFVAKFGFLKPAMLRTTCVHISTDCASAFRSFHTLFSYSSAPLLRKLSLNFRGCGPTPLQPPPRSFDACLWFQGTWKWSERRGALVRAKKPALDRLESLTLTGAVVPLPPNGFPSLQSLNIAHIPPSSSISAASLRSLIAHSPTLTSLGLFAASCPESSASPVPLALAYSLTDLHIAWNLDLSMSAFLSTLRLPNLDYVQMLLTSNHCVTETLRCSAVFSTVQTLCLYDYGNNPFSVHPIFSAFPLLEHLDLSSASPAVFHELSHLTARDIALGSTFCLPRLTTLSLPRVDLLTLKTFIHDRFLAYYPCTYVTNVTMVAPFLPAYDLRVYEYIDWLDYRLLEFTLTAVTRFDIGDFGPIASIVICLPTVMGKHKHNSVKAPLDLSPPQTHSPVVDTHSPTYVPSGQHLQSLPASPFEDVSTGAVILSASSPPIADIAAPRLSWRHIALCQCGLLRARAVLAFDHFPSHGILFHIFADARRLSARLASSIPEGDVPTAMASDDVRVAFNERCKVLSSDIVRFNAWFGANPGSSSTSLSVAHITAGHDASGHTDGYPLQDPSCFAPASVPSTSPSLAPPPLPSAAASISNPPDTDRVPSLTFSPVEYLQRRRTLVDSSSQYVLPPSVTSPLERPSRDALLSMDHVALVDWVTSCFPSPSASVADHVVPIQDLPSFCLASIHNAHFRLYVALQVALHRASMGHDPASLMAYMFDDMHATMIDLVAVVDRCRFDWPDLFLPAAHRANSNEPPSS
ncbi:hypothetical protein C8R43DRAFT_1121313 [Mycena crocata]|nr:hypothetical protein C8R43DRAFT_1121313 [Mycena crocata]